MGFGFTNHSLTFKGLGRREADPLIPENYSIGSKEPIEPIAPGGCSSNRAPAPVYRAAAPVYRAAAPVL
jgi:hypothetical protein